MGIPIELFEPFRGVGQAYAVFKNLFRFRRNAGAIIFDREYHIIAGPSRRNFDFHAMQCFQAVPDRIFHQRLQNKRRYERILRTGGDVELDAELVCETRAHNIEITVQQLQFLCERMFVAILKL